MEIDDHISDKIINILNNDEISIKFQSHSEYDKFINSYLILSTCFPNNIPKILRIDNDLQVIMEYVGNMSLSKLVKSIHYIQSEKYYKMAIDFIILLNNMADCTKLYSKYDCQDILTDVKNFVKNSDYINELMKLIPKNPINGIIHTDFIGPNILIKPNKLFVIDFQDMAHGDPLYDIVSLLYDSNTSECNIDRDKLMDYYLEHENNKFRSNNDKYFYILCRLIRSLIWRICRKDYSTKMQVSNNINMFLNICKSINMTKLHDMHYEMFKDYIIDINVESIILAAGKGSRMKNEIPKPMTNLFDKSMIQHIIDNIDKENINIVCGYKKELLIDHLSMYDNINFITQERQDGTGDAIKCCLSHLSKDYIMIIMGDFVTISRDMVNKLIEYHVTNKCDACIVSSYSYNGNLYRNAIIERDDNDKFMNITEYLDYNKPMSNKIEYNSGMYIFNKNVLSLTNEIDNNNVKKEYYFTDIFKIMKENNMNIGVFNYNLSEPHGANTQEELDLIRKLYIY